MPTSSNFLTHSYSSSFLYSLVKIPVYETIPAPIKESPGNKSNPLDKTSTSLPHLTFSSESPSVNF